MFYNPVQRNNNLHHELKVGKDEDRSRKGKEDGKGMFQPHSKSNNSLQQQRPPFKSTETTNNFKGSEAEKGQLSNNNDKGTNKGKFNNDKGSYNNNRFNNNNDKGSHNNNKFNNNNDKGFNNNYIN